jgi:hypothetical protein
MSIISEQAKGVKVETNVRTVSRVCSELGLEYNYYGVGFKLPHEQVSDARGVEVIIPNANYIVFCECYNRVELGNLCNSMIIYTPTSPVPPVWLMHLNENDLRNYLAHEINKNAQSL